MRSPLRVLVLALCAAGWAAASTGDGGGVQTGQVWTLRATTADGEQFLTTLRLDPAAPTGRPATFRADRGFVIVDTSGRALVLLDLADAGGGGLALACAYVGPLDTAVLEGVLAAGPLEQLAPLLEAALTVAHLAHSPAERAEASRELRLGLCTLTREPATPPAR